MALTKLNKQIIRETEIEVDGRLIVVCLDPVNGFGVKLKGNRGWEFADFLGLAQMMGKAPIERIQKTEIPVEGSPDPVVDFAKITDKGVELVEDGSRDPNYKLTYDDGRQYGIYPSYPKAKRAQDQMEDRSGIRLNIMVTSESCLFRNPKNEK